MFPPPTLMSLKAPDFNIHIMMSRGNPQSQKKAFRKSRIHFRTYLPLFCGKPDLTESIWFLVMETKMHAEEKRNKQFSMVRHSAGWTEQAAGTHIQRVSSTIRPLTSSQTTEQSFLPSWGQGKKPAGFPPSCGPGLRTPLGVRRLCVLTSSATGWSEKLSRVQSHPPCTPQRSLQLQLEQCMGNIRVDPVTALSPEIPCSLLPMS